MCPHRLHLDTTRMNADLALLHDQPAPGERVLFWVYQLATYVSFNVIDDAAMLSIVFV